MIDRSWCSKVVFLRISQPVQLHGRKKGGHGRYRQYTTSAHCLSRGTCECRCTHHERKRVGCTRHSQVPSDKQLARVVWCLSPTPKIHKCIIFMFRFKPSKSHSHKQSRQSEQTTLPTLGTYLAVSGDLQFLPVLLTLRPIIFQIYWLLATYLS